MTKSTISQLGGTSASAISGSTSGVGYDTSQKLELLRQLMPDLDAKEVKPGLWRVSAPLMMELSKNGIATGPCPEGTTRDAAIDDAFKTYTEGAPKVVTGFPDSERRVEVRWHGNGWTVERGSLQLLKEKSDRGIELSRREKATVGQIANKETVPARTLIGVYHKGERPTSEAARILDRGFEADKGGNWERALKDYQLAFGVFRAEVSSKHADRLRAKGIDPDDLLMKTNAVVVKSMLEHAGILDDVPSVKDTLKKYFNRTGLATKHQADANPSGDAKASKEDYAHAALMCELALGVDPGYGAAHYNKACIAWRGFQAEGEALAALKSAIADKSYDFKKLAREGDTDWNGLRQNAEFRSLVGLPPL